jgi:hypothetical protein
LSKYIIKSIDDKSVVWIEESNRYFVVQNETAEIIDKIQKGKSIQEITNALVEQLDIPFDEVESVVMNIKETILDRPVIRLMETPKKFQALIPTSLIAKYYLIHSKIIKVEFSELIDISFVHDKFIHLEIDPVDEVDHTFSIHSKNDNIYLSVDGESIDAWNSEEVHYFEGKFAMKIIEIIYEKTEDKWLAVFHASALNYLGNGLLILGDSGNGKSTSLALLQAHGFDCIADDFVPIGNDEKIYTFPSAISIKTKSVPVLLPYYPELDKIQYSRNGRLQKTMKYLPPVSIDYEERSECKVFVFIKYSRGTGLRCDKITNSVAIEELIPDSWISSLSKNVQTFLNWFVGIPCYRITYSDNDKMINQVKQLMESGL